MISVDKNGTGEFCTISDALDHAANLPCQDRKISIKPGIYNEKIRVVVPGVTLLGADPETTIITFDDYARKPLSDGRPMGTFNSYTVNIAAEDVLLHGLSLINLAGFGEEVGQSVALYADADRFVCHNCKLISHQDTLCTGPLPVNPPPKGVIPVHSFAGYGQYQVDRSFRQYYSCCAIQGDVDFIFGSATAVFDKCTIISSKRKSETDGYITAASTLPGEPFGYVFRNCNVIGDATNGSVYLGRPWRISAKTVFLNSFFDLHVNDAGWHDWDNPASHAATFYAEFQNSGPGSNVEKRPSWIKMLSHSESLNFTPEHIFSRGDNWNPLTEITSRTLLPS